MPGWKNSDRRASLPADWEKRRKDRLQFDNYQCTTRVQGLDGVWRRCTAEATDVDHHRNRDAHGREDLRSLCGWHHDKKSGREGALAMHKIMAENRQRFSRKEEHPYL